jgi:hypothetical protein
MINALNHLTSRDKLALSIFAGMAMLCSFYFASGILVTYVSQPAEAMEEAKDGQGFTIRVLGLQTFEAAEELSVELQGKYGVSTKIDAGPAGQGYLVIVGPLAKSADAETIKNALQNKRHIVRIIQNCGPGIVDCAPTRSLHGSAPSNPNSNPASGQGKP